MSHICIDCGTNIKGMYKHAPRCLNCRYQHNLKYTRQYKRKFRAKTKHLEPHKIDPTTDQVIERANEIYMCTVIGYNPKTGVFVIDE